MKKVLSLVLVIAMVLSSMSFAFAGTFEDVSGDYEKAIETLKGLGIIDGYDDGTFRPENTITRAEMAKLMVQILGYGDLVSGAKSNFTDTQGHWADAWISIAAGRNIVIGDGNGKFRPDAQVTYNEVLTMVVRGLGYTDDSNEIKSMAWPTNFKVKAAEIGITDGVKMSTTGADRGGVAQALFNALDATLVSVDVEGNTRALQDKNNRDLELITRIAFEKGNEDAPFRVEAKHLDPKHKDYAGDIVDLGQYLYEDVKAYASRSDHDLIVYVAESYSDTVVGTLKKDTTDGEIKVQLEDKSNELVDWATDEDVAVYYNGKEVKLNETELENGNDTVEGLVASGVAKVKVVQKDNYDTAKGDNDGDVRAVVVTNPTHAQKVASGYKKDALTIGRINLPQKGDKKVDLSKVTVTGAVEDINDIEENDVVVAYAAGGAKLAEVPSFTKLVVVRDTVEGTITKVNKALDDSTTIYVDGTKYTKSAIAGQTETFDVGFEGTYFIDDAGRLFAADATSIADAKDYAVVIETFNGAKLNGRTVANAEIKVITAAGEVVTYKVDKDTEYSNKADVINANTLAFLKDTGATAAAGYLNQALVKIKVGSDNVVDRIEIVEEDVLASAFNKSNVDTTISSFEVAKNAPIFNIDTDGIAAGGANAEFNKKYYSVVDAENLPKYIDFEYYAYNTSGAYKVIVSTNADRSSIGTYALITGVNYVYNDSTTKVAEITALVDGVERTFYGEDNSVTVHADVIDTGVIVELEISGNEVTAPITKASIVGTDVSAITNKQIDKIGSAGIRVDNAWYELSEDVAVYLLNNDYEYVGTTEVADLAGYQVVSIFEINSRVDGFDIIVIKPYKAVPTTPGTPVVTNGVVTYIDLTNEYVYVDGVEYEIGDNTRLNTAKGTLIAKGFTNIAGALAADDEVTNIVVKDGVVVTFVAAKIASIDVSANDTEIEALPAVTALALTDKAAVDTAKANYEALTPAEKEFVKAANVTKLNALVAKIASLSADKDLADNQLLADAIDTEIEALPAVTAVALTDKAAVTTAKGNYDGATDAVKALVKSANVTKLNALVAKVAELQAQADALAAVNAAGTPAAMKAALENADLGLNLNKYNSLLGAQKDLVANAMITGAPYADVAAVQAALDAAI